MRAFVTVNAVVHQRMTGVEQLFDFIHAVTLFTLGYIVSREDQVIDNGTGIRPASEQVVVFEEGVVSVAGMRHHQRLHGDGVLLHQIRDTRIGVDNDLIGQPLLTMLIQALGFNKLFTKRPVRIVDRHPDAGVSVHHLFGGDHLDLVRVGIQSVEFRHAVYLCQIDIQQIKRPVGSIA